MLAQVTKPRLVNSWDIKGVFFLSFHERNHPRNTNTGLLFTCCLMHAQKRERERERETERERERHFLAGPAVTTVINHANLKPTSQGNKKRGPKLFCIVWLFSLSLSLFSLSLCDQNHTVFVLGRNGLPGPAPFLFSPLNEKPTHYITHPDSSDSHRRLQESSSSFPLFFSLWLLSCKRRPLRPIVDHRNGHGKSKSNNEKNFLPGLASERPLIPHAHYEAC